MFPLCKQCHEKSSLAFLTNHICSSCEDYYAYCLDCAEGKEGEYHLDRTGEDEKVQ